MHVPRLRTALSVGALALALAACDTADEPGPAADLSATEDAAASIANALALDGGGALDALAQAALVPAEMGDAASALDPGCTHERAFDEATMAWTRTVRCERGTPTDAFYALYGRTHQFRFDGPDGPQRLPEGATALQFAILDGEGLRRTPALTHELLGLEGELRVEDLDTDTVTVSGTYGRAATDTLRTRRAVRTLTYDLFLDIDEVRGPRGERGGWRRPGGIAGRPTSGTLSGLYNATVTFETRGGYRERVIVREFTITFGREGGRDVALIRLGDRTFRADPATGALLGVD